MTTQPSIKSKLETQCAAIDAMHEEIQARIAQNKFSGYPEIAKALESSYEAASNCFNQETKVLLDGLREDKKFLEMYGDGSAKPLGVLDSMGKLLLEGGSHMNKIFIEAFDRGKNESGPRPLYYTEFVLRSLQEGCHYVENCEAEVFEKLGPYVDKLLDISIVTSDSLLEVMRQDSGVVGSVGALGGVMKTQAGGDGEL